MTDRQHFVFAFTDFDGVEAVINRTNDDGFAWPEVLQDVVKVLEKQFGYDIAENITVKGVSLERLCDDPYAYISPLQLLREIDEQLGLFPETSAGMTD